MDDQGVVRNEQPPAQDGPSQQDQDGPHKKEAADDGSTPGDGTPGDGTPDDGSADKSQDLADAEQQTRDALAPFGDDAPTVDFSSNPIDPATVREINNAVQRLGADYPSTMQGLSHIGSQDFNQSLGPNNGDVLAYATPQDSSPASTSARRPSPTTRRGPRTARTRRRPGSPCPAAAPPRASSRTSSGTTWPSSSSTTRRCSRT
ncbi:hypothetical protein LUX39_22990 [Actinomadura madurae]|uniref:hypothetical protein n=1 Tax=Actinomadura madurae TaxID=1993 RepID=UPI0020D25F59|nr:hypothetical protein [Actinomadura madurae]MCP9950808.1 hypothetical protein [Actinomadura madurae]MCP9967587.1 hypothetical protein [Actinomadura madurae]MCQ0016250.1 hypothetical protein [Actinomadura madurae]